ncbi:MAG: DMT family transporter, partial [Actinomycetota bacterium]|nr:DMT family transporter [Actinomycetota bacterium]
MSILIGLLASVTYGIQDFIGGVVSRRNHVLTVVAWGQMAGVLFAAAGVPLLTDGPPSAAALSLGGAAGVAGMFGAALLYRGLARGRMSVVAPVTALLAASVPVLIGLISGERPTNLGVAGLVVALAAIALVSTAPEPGMPPRREGSLVARMIRAAIPEAVGAGLLFAGFFLLLDGVEDDAGLWPLVGARAAALVVVGIILAVTGV